MKLSREERPGLAAAFADMSASCARLDAPTYALLADHVREEIERSGPVSELLEPYADAAIGDMVPLRLLGAVHRLVLERRAPALVGRRWSDFVACELHGQQRAASITPLPAQ